MAIRPTITSPTDPALDELCKELSSRADQVGAMEAWPAESLAMCANYGVHQWFFPLNWGGQDWSETDILRGYLRLSAACLTTTFVLTQWQGACRRIVTSENYRLAASLIPDLISGKTFATVGISHLTTSRRHLSRPALAAEPTGDGFMLDGFSPWVTGAPKAQTIVTGATLADGRQILVAVPTDLPGVEIGEPLRLMGLSGSETGPVRFHQVAIDPYFLLAGPVENVMAQGVGAKTGGLQTSCLAIGLSSTALQYLRQQAEIRADLEEATSRLEEEQAGLVEDLFAISEGQPACSNEELRARANSLVLRATQATLAAAKGTGYVHGHPAGRWCAEALFFLVWSCPQPVLAANLCELAGLSD
ncbi:MAG: acyl-CoA dehydrogenase family protein [Planctomycetota bacterium]